MDVKNYKVAGMLETVLGNKTAAYTLLYIEAAGSGYASQIASTFAIPLNSVQQQLKKFESCGLLVSYTVGKTRLYEFNPRGRSVQNIRTLLSAELDFLGSENSPIPRNLYQQLFAPRNRPRATGKPVSYVPKELRS